MVRPEDDLVLDREVHILATTVYLVSAVQTIPNNRNMIWGNFNTGMIGKTYETDE